jgi:hypothetical protein
MGAGEFRTHLMDLADQIRATATNKIIEAYEKGDKDQLERIMLEHNLNLHVEQPISIESYRSYLRDTYFSWVNDYFERTANLPDPNASVRPGSATASICGDGALSRVANDASRASEQATRLENIDPSGGLLGNGIFEKISTINDKVESWKSGAADMFKDYFLPVIPAAIDEQVVVAKAMRNVMAANQSMLAISRDDADAIAHDTIAALEFSDGCCSGDNDQQTTLGIISGVAAIVAGIATLPFSGPIGAAAIMAGGFTVLDGAVSTWATVEDSRAQNSLPLGADTIEGVLESMAEALGKVHSELDIGGHALRYRVLTAIESYMTSDKLQFVAPAPVEFAYATQENVIQVVEGP